MEFHKKWHFHLQKFFCFIAKNPGDKLDIHVCLLFHWKKILKLSFMIKILFLDTSYSISKQISKKTESFQTVSCFAHLVNDDRVPRALVFSYYFDSWMFFITFHSFPVHSFFHFYIHIIIHKYWPSNYMLNVWVMAFLMILFHMFVECLIFIEFFLSNITVNSLWFVFCYQCFTFTVFIFMGCSNVRFK